MLILSDKVCQVYILHVARLGLRWTQFNGKGAEVGLSAGLWTKKIPHFYLAPSRNGCWFIHFLDINVRTAWRFASWFSMWGAQSRLTMHARTHEMIIFVKPRLPIPLNSVWLLLGQIADFLRCWAWQDYCCLRLHQRLLSQGLNTSPCKPIVSSFSRV